MKNFFEVYSSNTLAGTCTQSFFYPENKDKVNESMVFYKVFYGGEHNYSFLFSNTVDSTFSDGSVSQCNNIIGEWELLSLKAAVTSSISSPSELDFKAVKFGGNCSKTVGSGELFYTDPVLLSPSKGDYIVLKLEYRGDQLPYQPEANYPILNLIDGNWVSGGKSPAPSMIGCDLKTDCKIGFMGDSITQGLGTECDSYEHWNSVYAKLLGNGFSYWNLGIGFARASDAASCGIWMKKALENDIVFVCFGVNDIQRNHTAEQIIGDIDLIVDTFLKNGKRVVLQTVPPFDYDEKKRAVWNTVNDHIKQIKGDERITVFDCVSILGESNEAPYKAKFGGHPSKDGCEVWGKALYNATKTFVAKGKKK